MALGADDAEAAGLHHVLALLGAHGFGAGEGVVALFLRGLLELHALGHEHVLGEHLGVAAEQDVRASTGHVGGDGHGALAAGLGHDLGLALVELGIEDLVPDTAAVEGVGQALGALDGHGAHKDRLALGVAALDVVGHGGELVVHRAVDLVVEVHAAHGAVGRDLLHRELVDLAELTVLCHGGARHAGELVVEAEVVLQRDGGQRLVLLEDLDALFCLDGLVQALGVAAALHDAARELVDDLHLAARDHVLLVAVEHVLGLEGLLEVVHQLAGHVAVDVVDAEAALDLLEALVGGHDGVLGLVELVVLVGHEALHGAGEVAVDGGRLGAGARDDEGRARLVDQDGVDLVDDGVVVPALHATGGLGDHVVAQVVEAELRVGAVGDVGRVGGVLVAQGHAVLEQAHVHAHGAVQAAHPLGVAAREVVVDRDDVDALAVEGVEIAREGGDERLALAGLHLGDHAAVQRDGTHHLHVEVAHADDAPRHFADGREGVGEQVVEGLAVGTALLEQRRHGRELLVALAGVRWGKTVDAVGYLLELLELLIGSHRQDLGEQSSHRHLPFVLDGARGR